MIVLPVPRPYKIAHRERGHQPVPARCDRRVHRLAGPRERLGIPAHATSPILFRRRTQAGTDLTREYARALEARGVAHLLAGSKSFHHREEVETLRAALTAIEWPDDELSVFATLKGSLFAIPDEMLLRYRHEHGRLHPFHAARSADPTSVAGREALTPARRAASRAQSPARSPPP